MFADMHTHSEFSHDSECKIEDMYFSQLKRGTDIFAVTDHCDICYSDSEDVFTPIKESFEEVQRLNEKYSSDILTGVEIGDGFWFPKACKKIRDMLPYDVIIGSVHCVKSEFTNAPYSSVNFSSYTNEQIESYFDSYFNDILTMLDTVDFDILAHLTCPVRYIFGRYNLPVDFNRFREKTDKILKIVIDRGISLEINTSKYYELIHDFSPGTEIIKRFKSLGGKYITLGSDAHTAVNASNFFENAQRVLKEIGFDKAYYYKARKPVEYSL